MSTCYTKWQPTQYFPQLVMTAFLSPTYLLATIPGFGISHLSPDCLCDPYFNPEISLEPQLYPQGALISTLKSLGVRWEGLSALSKPPNITENCCFLGILAFPHLFKNTQHHFEGPLGTQNTSWAGRVLILVNIVY